MALLLLTAPLYSAPPQRIVSTAPSITETLYALGLGDRVAGVTIYCHYPPEARKKPKIGAYTEPDLETIASLRPDLVIIQKNPIRLAERLKALRLNVLEVTYDTVADIGQSITSIGEAAGVPDRAAQLSASIRSQLDEIRRRTTRFPPRKTFFVIGRTAGTLQDLVTAGPGSYLDEVIRIAGGVNAFAGARAAYPKVTIEEVLARAPEVIIDMGDMAETEGVTEEHKRSVVALWGRYPVLPAVKQHRVYAVASDIFVVPGPRVVEAVREFARLIHPEAR